MFKNIIITERDKKVFSLLNKIKVIDSWTLNWLINSNTKRKTFVKRLKFLKQKWYIENIKNEKFWEQIFSLKYSKKNLDNIQSIINEKIYKSNINLTNTLFSHEFYISKWLLYIKQQIDKKTWKINSIDNYISQYQVYEFKNSKVWLNNKKLFEKLVIPDWILNYNDNSFLIEIELNNSYQKFKQKMNWYKKMVLYLESINKNSNILKNNLILYIFVDSYKIERYKSIIKEVWIKDLNIKIKDLKEI